VVHRKDISCFEKNIWQSTISGSVDGVVSTLVFPRFHYWCILYIKHQRKPYRYWYLPLFLYLFSIRYHKGNYSFRESNAVATRTTHLFMASDFMVLMIAFKLMDLFPWPSYFGSKRSYGVSCKEEKSIRVIWFWPDLVVCASITPEVLQLLIELLNAPLPLATVDWVESNRHEVFSLWGVSMEVQDAKMKQEELHMYWEKYNWETQNYSLFNFSGNGKMFSFVAPVSLNGVKLSIHSDLWC